MSWRQVRVAPNAQELIAGFERIRDAMHLDRRFPKAAVEEAEAAAKRPLDMSERVDARDIDFVTIDPPGSRDLDQAFHAEESDDGVRVHYAIADVASVVTPGGALDRESWERGQTLYCPDLRIGLYPPALAEGVASLLPGQDRAALLWTIEVDAKGAATSAEVRRAVVRSREQLTYEEAQRRIDNGGSPSLQLLKRVGELRLVVERARGGINLEVPEQEIERTPDGFRLAYRAPLPVEEWNAQISLLTGISAAHIMIEGKVGLLRTMPPPDPETLTSLRLSATALDVEWGEGSEYPSVISSLDPSKPKHAALLTQATRLFRGTGYVAFDGTVPGAHEHHALRTPYAHVTAPLRRLADRYANEIVVALCAGTRPSSAVLEALPHLPEVMKESHRRDGELERRTVDLVEAAVLQNQIGSVFEGVVIEDGRKSSTIQLREPAVVARCDGSCGDLGDSVRVRVTEADPIKGRVGFEHVQA